MQEEEYKEFDDEDTMSMATKESEILQSYERAREEEEEIDDYEDFVEEGVLERNRKRQRIINIIFVLFLILILFIIIDIIAVKKYNKGPYFAIPGTQYKDGGTREYYGLGYKVISYHQVQGRRDKVLGFWNLKYNTNATTIKDVDLAIGIIDQGEIFYQKYHKKFVRIISTLQEVNIDKHQILLGYIDEDGKYTLDIVCSMVKDQANLDTFKENKSITIIGTMKERKGKTIYVENCFAEQ